MKLVLEVLVLFFISQSFCEEATELLLDPTKFDPFLFYGDLAQEIGFFKNESLKVIEIIKSIKENKTRKLSDWILEELKGIVSNLSEAILSFGV